MSTAFGNAAVSSAALDRAAAGSAAANSAAVNSAAAPYVGLLVAAATVLLAVGLVHVVARSAAADRRTTEVLPFQSGWAPREHALSRFHVRWYPLTLLFLAFDVEMLFMYPWAIVVGQLGGAAIIEMFVFLGVLLLGVVWAWREGALRWV